jgi:hypothetical protein
LTQSPSGTWLRGRVAAVGLAFFDLLNQGMVQISISLPS